MLEKLNVKLNCDNVIIQCNNQQMLCLMIAKIDKLLIKFKHVDIQNHWLHQEYQQSCITVHYIESKNMIINSLIKGLLLNSHHWFLDQMNLIDIWNHLQDCQINETVTTFESLKLMNIDWILHESSVSEFHEKFWIWMRFYSQIWVDFSMKKRAFQEDFDFIQAYFNLISLVSQLFFWSYDLFEILIELEEWPGHEDLFVISTANQEVFIDAD